MRLQTSFYCCMCHKEGLTPILLQVYHHNILSENIYRKYGRERIHTSMMTTCGKVKEQKQRKMMKLEIKERDDQVHALWKWGEGLIARINGRHACCTAEASTVPYLLLWGSFLFLWTPKAEFVFHLLLSIVMGTDRSSSDEWGRRLELYKGLRRCFVICNNPWLVF